MDFRFTEFGLCEKKKNTPPTSSPRQNRFSRQNRYVNIREDECFGLLENGERVAVSVFISGLRVMVQDGEVYYLGASFANKRVRTDWVPLLLTDVSEENIAIFTCFAFHDGALYYRTLNEFKHPRERKAKNGLYTMIGPYVNDNAYNTPHEFTVIRKLRDRRDPESLTCIWRCLQHFLIRDGDIPVGGDLEHDIEKYKSLIRSFNIAGLRFRFPKKRVFILRRSDADVDEKDEGVTKKAKYRWSDTL